MRFTLHHVPLWLYIGPSGQDAIQKRSPRERRFFHIQDLYLQRIMDTLFVTISKEEFNLFHLIDRKVYAILVKDLWRDPVDAMQMIALWLWFERVGFLNVIKKILSLPNMLINEIADEAWVCLKFINDPKLLFSSDLFKIPLTSALVEKEISLQFLRENQLAAVGGIAKITSDICVKCLTDIMEDARRRNAATMTLVQSFAKMGMGAGAGAGLGTRMGMGIGRQNNLPFRGRFGRKPFPVHPDDRTMFVTFSKGYPVSESEVREFFNDFFGDCIETLFMQEVHGDEQALFARIVFYDPTIIDNVLEHVIKAKFTINGKHVWMRKFVPKQRTRAPVPAQ